MTEDRQMKYKNWMIQPSTGNAAAIENGGIPPLTARVLASRGCASPEEAHALLECGRSLLHEPEEFAGIEAAVKRILHAIRYDEKICVYGDYDVDGITSTCLLTSFLRTLGGNVMPYVPNRLSEGYSLNNETLLELRQKGVRLIITVDCGITNIEETRFARTLGMDVVITDHHECKSELPEAAAVVNPHQPGCPYPFKQLAGVGVALKVALALTPPEERDEVFLSYVDLAAVGTVADVMELTDENRAIVTIGLEQLQKTRRPGLKMLLQEAGLEGKALTSTSISYSLAPRLNAAGRMGCPELAVRLLLTGSDHLALRFAKELCDLNKERQTVEMETFQQCATLLEGHPSMREQAIILAGENWHQGVIGIVASGLVERYQLPTFMICLENGRGKGSCRSNIEGFSLFSALEQCADLLDTFGGHEQAAGFTIPAQNIPEFRSRITAITGEARKERTIQKDLPIDVVLPDFSLLTLPEVEALQRLEPYGAGNPKPTFLMEGAQVAGCACVGGGRHSRLQLEKDGILLDAIFFSVSVQDAGLLPGSRVDVAFYPQINDYRGSHSVQLLVTDLRRSLTPMQKDLLLYQRYVSGEPLERRELLRLIPERQNFVAVWRYLSRPGAPPPVIEPPVTLTRHISAAVGQPQLCSTTLLCLEVFQERGLIDLSVSSKQVQVSVKKGTGKVNLEESTIMRRLRSMMND